MRLCTGGNVAHYGVGAVRQGHVVRAGLQAGDLAACGKLCISSRPTLRPIKMPGWCQICMCNRPAAYSIVASQASVMLIWPTL